MYGKFLTCVLFENLAGPLIEACHAEVTHGAPRGGDCEAHGLTAAQYRAGRPLQLLTLS